MSLSKLCFIVLMMFSQVAQPTPLNYQPRISLGRENYLAVQPEDQGISVKTLENPELVLSQVEDSLERANLIEKLGLKKMESESGDPPLLLPLYFKHQPIYKSLRRKTRDLRIPRKISSSAMPIQMQMTVPAYYPFLMAEMMPGSVKTRHPSIIAINGCPAYYIADHTGMCRQVFQYTVQFGQPSPTSFEPQPRTSGFGDSGDHHNPHYQHSYQPQPPKPTFFPQTFPSFAPRQQTSSPPSSTRLLSLLRNATKKKFDLSFLKKRSQNLSFASGEITHEDNIENLRDQILSALKITKNRNTSNKGNSGTRATTPDYDD